MPVPTHGPHCRTLFCRPSSCGDCGQEGYYWACTCGSKVLFDRLGDPWPKHECTGAVTVKSVSTYTYGVLSVVCPRCGKSVRKRDLDAHNYWTHGIGKKPKGESPRISTAERAMRSAVSAPTRKGYAAGMDKPMVLCLWCGAKVLRKNLQRHLNKKCPKSRR